MTKIAVVTGANRGLGFATARHLGRAGVKVLVGARSLANSEDAVERLVGEGFDAEPLLIDVNSQASVRHAAQQVAREHRRVDILVNNAGILPEATTADVDPLDLQLFRDTFETNVFGVISTTQEFLPLLRRSPSARVVNISSTMGSLTDQSDPASPYAAVPVPAYRMSKTAINGFTVALARMLADTSIKVNAVCPGHVQTDLGGPENRAAAPTTADDAAQIVAKMALIADDGPTGDFVDSAGAVAW
ncbi:MAG TPA: SDR family NAD(P)-dependent oxidoreductase [Baekduia sp.]|nr:SDR family NAD(P)-dependent oxidoreductase [Baekduia sp.]